MFEKINKQLVVIKDCESAFDGFTDNFFHQQPVLQMDIIVSKFMPEVRFVNSLRDSAIFRRLKFCAKYIHINW